MRTALHFSIASELTALGMALVSGVLLAILYRFFCLLRRFFGAGRRLTFLFDLCYVLAALLLLFLYGFLFLGGQVRLYALLAVALGFGGWRRIEKFFKNILKSTSIFHSNRV